MRFHNVSELLTLATERKIKISEVMIQVEMKSSSLTCGEIRKRLERYLDVMEKELIEE